jgi:lauroyl/myristoyl acyltransferase
MSRVGYWIIRAVVAALQTLPLMMVSLLGRLAGMLWWIFDFKHRALVSDNLRQAFPEKSRNELGGFTRETFQRIAENALAAVKTASMSPAALEEACEIVGLEKLPKHGAPHSPLNCIAAVGHFGNFELYVTLGQRSQGWQGATTYRGMNQPALDEIVQGMREKSGCLFFERRTEARALKEALSNGGVLLGLLADQRPGKGGVIVPFMGRECSTTAAPALFALRYEAPLFTMICYRIGLGRWRIEVGDEIPLRDNGQQRSTGAIMADVNRAFEAGVRRDPANWFWVHDRWKMRPVRQPEGVQANGLEEGFETPSA